MIPELGKNGSGVRGQMLKKTLSKAPHVFALFSCLPLIYSFHLFLCFVRLRLETHPKKITYNILRLHLQQYLSWNNTLDLQKPWNLFFTTGEFHYVIEITDDNSTQTWRLVCGLAGWIAFPAGRLSRPFPSCPTGGSLWWATGGSWYEPRPDDNKCGKMFWPSGTSTVPANPWWGWGCPK